MSNIPHSRDGFPVFAARFGDLMHEAKVELDPDTFADFIVLAAYGLSRHFGDVLEERWQAAGE